LNNEPTSSAMFGTTGYPFAMRQLNGGAYAQ
jgi:hypothetical protein